MISGYRVFLLDILLLAVLSEVVCISCPYPCSCDIIAGADCSNSSLTQLPPFLDREISILKANNNSVKILSRFTFSKKGDVIFPYLIVLSLQRNKIKTIEPLTFEGMKNLKELDLNSNKIAQINPSVFRHLHKLKSLFLEDNEMLVLERGMFRELISLSVLDLSLNHIKCIKDGAFGGLGSLKKLYLRSNKIETLNTSVFRNLGSLIELDLSTNLIRAVQREAFRGLWSLQVLELMFNQITTIETDSFIDLSNLDRLDLEDNLIDNLGGSVFKGLENLDTLYLSGNAFQHLGSDSFIGLRNLTTIYLTETPIITIEPSTFQQTPSLEFLFLNSDPFITISEEEPFLYSVSLLYLDLSDCNLTHIPQIAFSGISNLISLDLSNNKLENLDREVLTPLCDRLDQVLLDFNPLNCDCNLKSTWVWCKNHKVVLTGECKTKQGNLDISKELLKSVDCVETTEKTNTNNNPNDDIEIFVPVAVPHNVVTDDDEDSHFIPEHSSELPRTINGSKGCHHRANNTRSNPITSSVLESEETNQVKLVSQNSVVNNSKLSRKDTDKAWSVVLCLSVTVCLLLMLIAGLLISLLFYRRHNRTIIYSVPQ